MISIYSIINTKVMSIYGNPHVPLFTFLFQSSISDYIQYWLGSIHTYSSQTAPVILVASHSKKAGKKVQLYTGNCLIFSIPYSHTNTHI